MEDKIEVNEYVRTKNGVIDKVDALYGMIENTVHLENQKWFDIKNIVKHRKKLKDLIEKDDYVNGYKVISVDYDVMNDTTECIELDLNSNYQYNFISIRQIQTILTKEQYMANCYEVGGEENETSND